MKKIILIAVCLLGCSNKNQHNNTAIMVELGEYHSMVTFNPKTHTYQLKIELPASKKLKEKTYKTYLIQEAKKEAISLCKGESHIDDFKTSPIETVNYTSKYDYYKFMLIMKSEFKCKNMAVK